MNAFATMVQSIAWPITLLIIGYFAKDRVFDLLSALRRQILAGATFKFKDIEYKGVDLSDFEKMGNSSFVRESADDEILKRRNEIYAIRKNIFLVHRARESGKVHPVNGLPTYDISIYLIGHKSYGAINDIKEVQYFFGKYFGLNQSSNGTKYIVRNGTDGFAVSLNAYGPTLCEARVVFHDGTEALFDRYLDFEGTGYRFDDAVSRHDEKKSIPE
jgi:hypothetical protein